MKGRRIIMKPRLWKLFCTLGILAIAGGAILLSGRGTMARASDFRDDDDFGGALQGTWRVEVGLVNCQTGAAMGPAFPSLLSFVAGGTMSEGTVNPAFGVGQRLDGFGIWKRTGRHTYNAKSVAFIAYTTPANPPMSPGFTAGTQTITQTIKFEDGRDKFTSDAAIEFADSTGAVYRSGCAVATGQRFE
jgi:hypothetical protein